DVYFGGEYEDAAAFGSTILTNAPGSNIFIGRTGCLNISGNTASGSQSICAGTQPNEITGSLPSGPAGSYTYLWEQSPNASTWTNATGNCTAQSYSPPVLFTDMYYRRKIIATGTCSAVPNSNDVFIKTDLAVTAVAASDFSVCSVSATLAAVPPAAGSGTWSIIQGQGTISAPNTPSSVISNLGTGASVYRWTVGNGACPTSYDDIIVWRDAAPDNAVAGNDAAICTTSLQLSANTPFVGSGKWTIVEGQATIGSASTGTTYLTGISPGKSVVRWTISNGVCPASSDEITVWRDLPPDAAFAGPDVTLDIPVLKLSANTPTSGTGSWSVLSGEVVLSDINDPKASIVSLSEGESKLRWTMRSGSCPENSDDLTIFLKRLEIPNAFTPNGDGVNDSFVIPTIEYYPGTRFYVYNRWGSLVYYNDEYKNSWKGTNLDNERLTDDTYYYTLEIPSKANYNGFIILKYDK
ncbi:MAG: hypothetical protein K0S12_2180, partial [Bacteroidetes bacterium]|nr:hypothetical protein [Bacteroidota bacterium]